MVGENEETDPMFQGKPRFLLILFIALSQFSSALMHSIMGVALPAMGSELDASGVELGLVESIFLGTAAALLLPIGRFADATDRNTLFKAGLVGLAAMTFAIGLQESMASVIGFRLLQGIAAALMTATGMAIVADIVPRNQLGSMLGLAIGATYFGLASGPFFSGFLTTHLGWRWVFFLAAVPPLLSYVMSRATLESRWRAPTASINLPNSALLIVAIAMFIAGAATLGKTAYGFSLTAFGVFLGALFLVLECRASNPLLKIHEIRANKGLTQALWLQLLIYSGAVGTMFMLSIYLQVIRGHTPETAGHILVIGPVVMAAFAPFIGRLADRVAPGRLSALGATLILCSVTLAAFVTARTGLGLVIAIMVFQGLGFAFFSAPNIMIIMNSVDASERGLASALTGIMRSLGMMISMFIVTALLSMRLGTDAIADRPDAFLAVMTWSFAIFAGLAAIGVAMAVSWRRTARGAT